MASVRRLTLPPLDGRVDGGGFRGGTSEAGGGWDNNIGERGGRGGSHFTFGPKDDADGGLSGLRPSACRHAVAHGCSVLRIAEGREVGYERSLISDGDRDDDDWIAWEAPLGSRGVRRVESNADGTVVAASTDDGRLTLLRGSDGDTLATRRVRTDEYSDASLPSLELTFVSLADDRSPQTGDVLLVVAPPSERDDSPEGGPMSDRDFPNNSSVLIVSNINGPQLDSDVPSLVARAARNMSVDPLELDLPFGGRAGGGRIASLSGAFLDATTIRLVAADTHGNVSAHDYDLEGKTSRMVKTGAFADVCVGGRWTLDQRVGFRVDDGRFGLRRGSPRFLLTSHSAAGVKISWRDASTLELLCEHVIPSSPSRGDRRIVLALEPVGGYDGEGETVAAAVAISGGSSPPSSESFIQVVQAIVDDGENGVGGGSKAGLKSLPQVVFKIPIPSRSPTGASSASCSVDIAAIRHAGTMNRHYFSFRYIVSFDGLRPRECVEFAPPNGDGAGQFRALLAWGRFDEADELLAAAMVDDKDPSRRSYAFIHSSEVALWRFRHMLAGGDVSHDRVPEARECLRRLAAGAVSGGEIGFRCLVDASENLLSWPTDPIFSCGASYGTAFSGPRMRDYRIALSGMSLAVASAVKAVTDHQATVLKEERVKLDARASAIQCLESVLGVGNDGEVRLTPPLSSVTSPVELFRTLVSMGAVATAERVRRSEHGRAVTPEVMALSVVAIEPVVDPRSYCNLLQDVILPGLTINHPLLLAVQSWACRIADAFDDNDNAKAGIDCAILLLKTVADGTAKLSTAIHSSFASSSPFREGKTSNAYLLPEGLNSPHLMSPSGSIDTSFSTLGFDSPQNTSCSKYTPSPLVSTKPPKPTIMKLDLSRRTGHKERRVLLSTSSSRSTGPVPFLSPLSTCGSSHQSSTTDDIEVRNDCSVEAKLSEAKQLKVARSLGLSKAIVQLSTYTNFGGSSFIAKELIRTISDCAANDTERDSRLINEIRPFCECANVSFDFAIAQFTKELCEMNRNNPRRLHVAACLPRLCSDPATKCMVALKVIRAALLCNKHPKILSVLSRDALSWAMDEKMRSELEEAARLLVIDGIIRRYCGNGAQEFFRVGNPRHGYRLLGHVCRHIDEPSVLFDALSLCDAFTHLPRLEACVQILQRMILAPDVQNSTGTRERRSRADQCSDLFRHLFSLDEPLANEVGLRLCAFCISTIEESLRSDHCFKEQNNHAVAACSGAVCVLSIMQDQGSLQVGSASSPSLLREMQRLLDLQVKFSMFLSLSQLRKGTKHEDIARLLLSPAIELLMKEEKNNKIELRSELSHARRGCELLFGDDQTQTASLWCKVIGQAAIILSQEAWDDSACMDFVDASGLLDDIASDSAFKALISISLVLCSKGSSNKAHILPTGFEDPDKDFSESQPDESILLAMRCIVRANSLVEEHAMPFCSSDLLPSVVTLSSLTDTVSQVLVRADSGVGEAIDAFRRDLNDRARKRRESPSGLFPSLYESTARSKLPSSPSLHPSWYVGDGLLLPPPETLSFCIAYCKGEIQLSNTTHNGSIYNFLESRGAYSIGLRMLAISSSNGIAANVRRDPDLNHFSFPAEHVTFLQDGIRCLAERSLGGSGNGITSGNIDSQLAFAYLLSLPIKLAFKVYRACLPSAISRRDFSRVVCLANIGDRCGTSGRLGGGWSKQHIFIDQCRRLSSNARWWDVLSRNGVSFDPRKFEEGASTEEYDHDHNRTTAKDNISLKYIASLVLPLIHGSSKFHSGASLDEIFSLATKYVCAFGLDPKLAAQKLVEFLLSCPDDTSAVPQDRQICKEVEIRNNISACESAVKEALLLLPSSIARSAVLRRCLISLESSRSCCKDYERFSLVLSLYYAELSRVLSEQQSKGQKLDIKGFREEMERIERRRDALAVLSSVFCGAKIKERPSFSDFFLPLPNPFKSDRGKASQKLCSILGSQSESKKDSEFDPLLPLQPCLSADSGISVASALSPMCPALGLPPGYIHARSLSERFLKARKSAGAFPPFIAVKPVISKIVGARDSTVLLEWCARQYEDGSKERLKCLELALSLAMKASREAEKWRLHNKDDRALENEEKEALNVVRRISDTKSALSDRIRVNEILTQGINSSCGPQVTSILSSLVKQVQDQHTGSDLMSPDDFVEGLLIEGSMAAALASLNDSINFTTEDFRQIASSVHKAAKVLSDQYSHLRYGKRARGLARRWLVHGDEVSSSGAIEIVHKLDDSMLQGDQSALERSQLLCDDEDDTENFVMDLNTLGQGREVWSDDVGAVGSNWNKNPRSTTSEEEVSAWKKRSAREASEFAASRAGLRIAFMMSFADDYHSEKTSQQGCNDESYHVNYPKPSSRANKVSKLAGLQFACGASSEGDVVMRHARELLSIVFAQSGAENEQRTSRTLQSMSPLTERTPLADTSSTTQSKVGLDRSAGKTHTFAMRHRALRAASILCPQEALEIVVREEAYFGDNDSEVPCTLSKCSFGSFLAMEIEAMGLPLPHSNLVRLSTMHFPSYARSLWRHHGQSQCRGYKGRLLLLLLELCLKDGKTNDSSLVVSVINELSTFELPRTILRSCEFLADLEEKDIKELIADNEIALSCLVKKTAQLILGEVQRSLTADVDTNACLRTVERLGKVVTSLNAYGLQGQLPYFVAILCNLASTSIAVIPQLSEGILEISATSACCLDKNDRVEAFSKIAVIQGGKSVLKNRFITKMQLEEDDSEESQNSCTILLEHAERSAITDLASAINE